MGELTLADPSGNYVRIGRGLDNDGEARTGSNCAGREVRLRRVWSVAVRPGATGGHSQAGWACGGG